MIVGAMLGRNEARRHLRRVLENVTGLVDEVVFLDDQSIDDTPKIAETVGARVFHRQDAGGWWNKNEAPARHQLWQLAVEAAGPKGWIYVADCDHELLGLSREELHALTRTHVYNAWAFPLWDCWDSDELQRVDGYWQAWRNPRPWLFKAHPTEDFKPEWNGRTIHVGHSPQNYPFAVGIAPSGSGIRHLSYWHKEDRKAKLAKYLSLTEEPHANGQPDSVRD